MNASRLPNAGLCLVEEKKIRDYLLNHQHVHGASKAGFFSARGFSLSDWPLFAQALAEQGRNNRVTRTTSTAWGTRYQVDCHCPTPDGRNPCIRTVWEVSADGAPRLLTAHPLKQ
jgi:hypothetical protein